MGITVKHARTSTKPPGPDPDKIQAADWNADHLVTGTGLYPVGTIIDYCGVDVPAGWLECAGQVVSAATYPDLFAALVKSGTVSISIASPAVISWTNHGRRVGDVVGFQSTGSLPTGIITADLQTYRIISAGFSANSFRIALTWEGAAINTSGTQSGVHTGIHAPFGVSTGLSSFALPDLRAVALAGITNMGGAQSSKTALGYQMGHGAGVEKIPITVPNLPPHDHSIPVSAVSRSDNPALGTRVATVAYAQAGVTGLGAGTSTPLSVMQPTMFVKKLIHTGV